MHRHRIMSESFKATTGLVTTAHTPETSIHPSLIIRSDLDQSQDLFLVKKNKTKSKQTKNHHKTSPAKKQQNTNKN